MTIEEIVNAVRPYHCLFDLAAELPALIGEARGVSTLLEIGTYLGGTSAALAMAYPELRITTIDLPDPRGLAHQAREPETTGKALRDLRLDRVNQVRMDSRDLGAWVAEGRRFDLVFVDGNHMRDFALSDLAHAALMLTPGGKIIEHDYTGPSDASRPPWTVEVQLAVDAFLAARVGWTLTRLPGWLIRLDPPRVAA